MKTLLLLRHAKSSWSYTDLSDFERPLNDRGKRDAPRMGELAKELELTPELIVSSTAKRAAKTAKKFAKACGYDREIVFSDKLYQAAPEVYLNFLQNHTHNENRILMVGHNPGLEELLYVLTGRSEAMPAACLAQVDIHIRQWSDIAPDGKGRLTNIWRPRHLPC